MPELRLLNAERTREKLTVAQERHIRRLYREALAEVQEWSKRLEGKDNISSILRRQYLDQMEKELTEAMEHIGSDTETNQREYFYYCHSCRKGRKSDA